MGPLGPPAAARRRRRPGGRRAVRGPVRPRPFGGGRRAWFPAVADPAADDVPDGPGDRWVATTIGAPTPTDEPLSLPAGLVGTFPVDDTRRRLAPGPLTDHLLDAAVDAYVELLAVTDPTQRWRLLPTAGFPVGPIDGRLRDGIVTAAAAAPLLLTAAGDEVAAERALPAARDHRACCRPARRGAPRPARAAAAAAVPALRTLGVRTTDLSAASGALAGIDRPAEFWGELYRELDAGDRPDLEALADLPVPVLGAAGRPPRRAFGPRGLLLPPVDAGEEDLSALRRLAGVVPGLRVVDPDAASPLLERLGARPATPSAVLADPAVAAAVRQVLDEPDLSAENGDGAAGPGSPLTRAILDLVAAGAIVPPALIGSVVLTDVEGEPARADELHLPGSPLAALVHPDDLAPLHPRWSQDYSRTVLSAVGVRDGFVVVELADPSRDGVPGDAELPDLDDWLDLQVGAPPPVTAVLDLDLIDEDRWPQALAGLAADPAVRAAVRPGADGPSYAGWWLGEFAEIEGVPLRGFRLPTAADLDGLYEALPVGLDAEFARGCGVLGRPGRGRPGPAGTGGPAVRSRPARRPRPGPAGGRGTGRSTAGRPAARSRRRAPRRPVTADAGRGADAGRHGGRRRRRRGAGRAVVGAGAPPGRAGAGGSRSAAHGRGVGSADRVRGAPGDGGRAGRRCGTAGCAGRRAARPGRRGGRAGGR